MKTKSAIFAAATVAFCSVPCYAIPVAAFQDTDHYIQRSADIVVGKCIAKPEGGPMVHFDGLYPANVEVLMVITGQRKTGPLKIATIHDVKPGTIYMLANSGGSAFGTDFLAIAELTVVPLPANFDLAVLKGMTVKQQVQRLMAVHLAEVQRQLAPLEAERDRLVRGLADRTDDLYQSHGKVHIAHILETSTAEVSPLLYALQLGPAKLEWSQQSPGSSGYVYYRGPGKDPVSWEFASSPHKEINDFDGKPLEVRFYGQFSPASPTGFLMRAGETPTGQVGQIILARTTADPRTIYIVKFDRQAEHKESVTISYAVVQDHTVDGAKALK